MRGHVAQRGNPTHIQGPEHCASSLRAAGPSFIHADFRHFNKGGDYFHCQQVGLRRTDSPREEPALPVIRQFQVRREWCPETVFTGSLSVNPDGYGPRVVGNTYQKG